MRGVVHSSALALWTPEHCYKDMRDAYGIKDTNSTSTVKALKKEVVKVLDLKESGKGSFMNVACVEENSGDVELVRVVLHLLDRVGNLEEDLILKDERLKVMGRKLQLVESMACSGCKASAGSFQEGVEVAAASAEGMSSSREESASNRASVRSCQERVEVTTTNAEGQEGVEVVAASAEGVSSSKGVKKDEKRSKNEKGREGGLKLASLIGKPFIRGRLNMGSVWRWSRGYQEKARSVWKGKISSLIGKPFIRGRLNIGSVWRWSRGYQEKARNGWKGKMSEKSQQVL